MRGGLICSRARFSRATPTTEIYTLSLHDALPISLLWRLYQIARDPRDLAVCSRVSLVEADERDRKSTRLNSSHMSISYAVFCLKKKNKFIIDANHALSTPILARYHHLQLINASIQ